MPFRLFVRWFAAVVLLVFVVLGGILAFHKMASAGYDPGTVGGLLAVGAIVIALFVFVLYHLTHFPRYYSGE